MLLHFAWLGGDHTRAARGFFYSSHATYHLLILRKTDAKAPNYEIGEINYTLSIGLLCRFYIKTLLENSPASLQTGDLLVLQYK